MRTRIPIVIASLLAAGTIALGFWLASARRNPVRKAPSQPVVVANAQISSTPHAVTNELASLSIEELFAIARTNLQQRPMAVEAIRSKGRKAVPFLMNEAWRGMGFVERQYREHWRDIPVEVRKALPRPSFTSAADRLLAVQLLHCIGPEAAEATEDLLELLEKSLLERKLHTGITVRSYSPSEHYLPSEVTSLLATMGATGADDDRIILRLIEISKASRVPLATEAITPRHSYIDPNWMNSSSRFRASGLLPAIHKALPKLSALATDEDALIAREARTYLGALGQDKQYDLSDHIPLLGLIMSTTNLPFACQPGLLLNRAHGPDELITKAWIEGLAGGNTHTSLYTGLMFTKAPDVHPYADKAFNTGAESALATRCRKLPATVRALESALSHTNSRIRAGACRALGEAGQIASKAGTRLAELAANDASEAVRYHAAVALEQLGDASAIKPFKIKELKSRSTVVRSEAMDCCRSNQWADAEVVNLLANISIKDDDLNLRARADQQLREMKADPKVIINAFRAEGAKALQKATSTWTNWMAQ